MKRNIVLFGSVCVALLMQSCYNSTVCVGDMKKNEPAVCVNTVHNHHFISGLVGSSKIEGNEYVNGQDSYKVKHFRSFTDLLLSGFTGGIYAPTTTKIYLPVEVKSNKKSIVDESTDK